MSTYAYLKKGPVIVSFMGDVSHEIEGELIAQDDRGIVVKHDGYEKVIPWTAIGAVANTTTPID